LAIEGWLAAAVGRNVSFGNAFVGTLIANLINWFLLGTLIAQLLVARRENMKEAPGADLFGGVAGLLGGLLVGALVGTSYQVIFQSDVVSAVLTTIAAALIAGVGLGLFVTVIPSLEWRIENLPPRLLGAVGAGLILAGFLVQSLQYIVRLLDIPVR
jgi:uncharacterized protein YacL